MQLPGYRLTSQTTAWFRDLQARGLLDLSPPYQRRSVWNQSYKDSFVDTVLLGYPCPPIFLHETISSDGIATYSVIDGQQRLTAIIEFADDLYPVAESSVLTPHQGVFFSRLPDDVKRSFWTYQLAVAYLPSVDEAVLTDVFNRLNKNVAKLTRQELRHARYSGKFARAAESAADILLDLPRGFPRIAAPSRRQMKDVEFAAQLLLLVEKGPRSFSQDELDAAYSDRDEEWDTQNSVERRYRDVVALCDGIAKAREQQIVGTRLRNQADFYGLFGALLRMVTGGTPPRDMDSASDRLYAFMVRVDDEKARTRDDRASQYYQAARSASNDPSRRTLRINTLASVLEGEAAT